MTGRGRAPRWRGPFLRALAAGGNVRLAAEQAGVDHSVCYYRRKRDAEFAAAWERALAQAEEGVEAALPQRRSGGGEELVVRHSRRCGPQLVKAAAGRWSAGAERTFLGELGRTGNIRRAARAAGFSATAIHNRMNAYPGFAAACAAAIARARADLESLVLAAGIAAFDPGGVEEDEAAAGALPRVTAAEAIALLRLNPSAKGARAAAGAAGMAEEPSIEEVQDEVLRRLAAIRRSAAGGGDGAGG